MGNKDGGKHHCKSTAGSFSRLNGLRGKAAGSRDLGLPDRTVFIGGLGTKERGKWNGEPI